MRAQGQSNGCEESATEAASDHLEEESKGLVRGHQPDRTVHPSSCRATRPLMRVGLSLLGGGEGGEPSDRGGDDPATWGGHHQEEGAALPVNS